MSVERSQPRAKQHNTKKTPVLGFTSSFFLFFVVNGSNDAIIEKDLMRFFSFFISFGSVVLCFTCVCDFYWRESASV